MFWRVQTKSSPSWIAGLSKSSIHWWTAFVKGKCVLTTVKPSQWESSSNKNSKKGLAQSVQLISLQWNMITFAEIYLPLTCLNPTSIKTRKSNKNKTLILLNSMLPTFWIPGSLIVSKHREKLKRCWNRSATIVWTNIRGSILTTILTSLQRSWQKVRLFIYPKASKRGLLLREITKLWWWCLSDSCKPSRKSKNKLINSLPSSSSNTPKFEKEKTVKHSKARVSTKSIFKSWNLSNKPVFQESQTLNNYWKRLVN